MQKDGKSLTFIFDEQIKVCRATLENFAPFSNCSDLFSMLTNKSIEIVEKVLAIFWKSAEA